MAVRGTGVVSLIDRHSDVPVYTATGRFMKVPLSFAERYCQTQKHPLLLNHKTNLKIGTIENLFINEDALCVEFRITNPNFLVALRTASQTYYCNRACPVASWDGFIASTRGQEEDKKVVDVFVCLAQRLPGLSLRHDKDSLDVIEVSLCVTGARDNCVLKEAYFTGPISGSEEGKVRAFLEELASLHNITNVEKFEKLARDFRGTGISTKLFSYSHGEPTAVHERTMNDKDDLIALRNAQGQLMQEFRALQKTLTTNCGKRQRENELYDDDDDDYGAMAYTHGHGCCKKRQRRCHFESCGCENRTHREPATQQNQAAAAAPVYPMMVAQRPSSSQSEVGYLLYPPPQQPAAPSSTMDELRKEMTTVIEDSVKRMMMMQEKPTQSLLEELKQELHKCNDDAVVRSKTPKGSDESDSKMVADPGEAKPGPSNDSMAYSSDANPKMKKYGQILLEELNNKP